MNIKKKFTDAVKNGEFGLPFLEGGEADVFKYTTLELNQIDKSGKEFEKIIDFVKHINAVKLQSAVFISSIDFTETHVVLKIGVIGDYEKLRTEVHNKAIKSILDKKEL